MKLSLSAKLTHTITFIYATLVISFFLGCSEKKKAALPISYFKEITDSLYLNFVHDPAVDGNYYMPESLGSGAAFLDYDNDGDLDIYFVNGAYHGQGKPPATSLKNQLFRQQVDGTFNNVTDLSGLGDTGNGMGVAVGDYDNDGFADVYVSNDGPDALYRNNGDGTFTNVTEKSGIYNPDWGISVVFFDFNLDNHLDIFVTNYVKYDTSVYCTDRLGNRDYCGPQGFPGYADKLFKNNGDGTFLDVSQSSGIAGKKAAGLGVISVDFNDDRYPDVYVGNDREQNHLWINQKDGTFKDQAIMFGIGYNGSGAAEASMGIAIGDIDQDEDMDLFLGHFMQESNTLYRNMGDMGFQDDTAPAALAVPSLPYTGFGTGFFDYDLDGDLDLAVVNGRVIRGELLTDKTPAAYWDYYAEPNLIFENDSRGIFKNRSSDFAEFSQKIENSRGLLFGDVDNDGDVDILVTNEGGKARLYRNDYKNAGSWLIVKAIDPQIKREMYGAKIKVETKDRNILRILNPGYSYCSSNDPRVHFGLGRVTGEVRIEVEWPDGTKDNISGVVVNQIITIHKGNGLVFEENREI